MDSVVARWPRASGSTASAAWAGSPCAPPGVTGSCEFAHVNELHGDAATAAHLLTFDSIHGRWPHDVRGDGGALEIDGTRDRLRQRRRSGGGAVGRARHRGRARVHGRVSHRRGAAAVLRRGRAQGRRRRAGQARRAERHRRGQRRPVRPREPRHRHGRFVHDELPRAGREGRPRGRSASATARSRRCTT